MTDAPDVPTGTLVTYAGALTQLIGIPMTVVYKNACGSCRHGGTYVLEFTDPSTHVVRRLEKVLRTSFTIDGE